VAELKANKQRINVTLSCGLDEVGYWSEIKLDIVRDYASAYSRILTANKLPHIYIDAFAGSGKHLSKTSGEFISGSPDNALKVHPPFREYHLIDFNPSKVGNLQKLVGDKRNVHIYEGDCNEILLQRVFPTLRFESFRRALCLLDPYGLDLNWKVIYEAGQLGTVDMFLNFPVMDINRNVLWRNPNKVSAEQLSRLNQYWGDDSWKQVAYTTERSLFGELEREPNESVAEGFRQRLISVAGFKRVPHPLPMRNTRGAVVYYLFFASQVGAAEKIVTDIFAKYKNVGKS
jgi:three-Cys-motif partner protein